jgi:RNA polymerase sigma-70 factor (ECF subfamily)
MRALAILATAGPMDSPQELSTVLEAAQAGDLRAFEQLMRQYERLVVATALRMLGDAGDAQDASQQVFFKLYRNLRKIEARSLPSWLYRVTVNVCHDLRRKRGIAVPVEDAGDLPAGGSDPQQISAEAERRRVLALSLRMLPEKERAALVLRDLEGLSTMDVARVLGSSEATVRSQVARARLKVRDFVERYFRRRS